MKSFVIGAFSFFLFSSLASAELLNLTNKEGKTIKAQLISRGEDSAKILVGKKTFTIKYDQLQADSVSLIVASEIKPILTDELELDVTIKKTSDKVTSTSTVVYSNGTTGNQYNSYRVDTVFGAVSINNRHNVLRSKNGEIKITILARSGSKINKVHTQSFHFKDLAPLGKQEFKVNSSKTAHSRKGSISIPGNLNNGRYYGYIAAIYIDGVQTAIKSVPAGYQKDPAKAEPFLNPTQTNNNRMRFR